MATSPSVSPELTVTLKAFVLAMFGVLAPDLPPPSVVPTNNGVQLEWHSGGVDIEVYISADEEITFSVEDMRSAEGSSEMPLCGNEDLLRRWLKRTK